MGEQLKVQTLYDVAEEDGKNLVWTDVYVSGTEGASGVYATRRMTWTQLLAYVNSNISAIVGSGTLNYVPRFTPDGATIGNSTIQDDGTTIGIGVTPSSIVQMKVSSGLEYAIQGTTNKATGSPNGVLGTATGASDSSYGVVGQSSNTNVLSVGVYGYASATNDNYGLQGVSTGGTLNVGTLGSATGVTGVNVGLYGEASNGSSNFCAKLVDGTEGMGKFLNCYDNNGYAHWADLTASDISSFVGLPCEIQLAVSDETTALTTGTGKLTFRMPHAMTLTEVRASLTTAQTSGGILTVDINKNGSTIFIANWLTIDNGEKTSVTALDQPIINVSSLADDDEITIDIDQIGSGDATGLKILLKGTRA